MARSPNDFVRAPVADSRRCSIVVGVATRRFIQLPPEERRASGPVDAWFFVDAEDEVPVLLDRIVTCVMVAWAVVIFGGMTYLAAVL